MKKSRFDIENMDIYDVKKLFTFSLFLIGFLISLIIMYFVMLVMTISYDDVPKILIAVEVPIIILVSYILIRISKFWYKANKKIDDYVFVDLESET